MNVDIELSQLKMMRSPAGESFRFKLLLEVALWLCLMVLIGVIILTSSMEISIVTGLVLSAFIGFFRCCFGWFIYSQTVTYSYQSSV